MSSAASLRAQLKKMTASKSSIHDATKAVSSFPGSTSESLGVIVQIMREVGQASKRVPLWYLMDSVAQYAKRKGNVKLSAAVLATVPAVIPLMLDPASGGDAKGEEAVTKVLDVWERHKIYTGDEIASALKVTAPLAPLAPHSPILPPPPDPHTVGSSLGDGALLPTPLLPTPIMERPAPARTAVDAQLERTAKLLLIFELDGTLIQLESLSSGSFSGNGDVDAEECKRVGYELEDALFRCLDENFWYRDIESRDKPLTAYDHVRLEDSRPFPDTLLNDTSVPPNVLHAQRYRAIRAYYNGSKPRPFSTDPSSEMGAILHAVHTVTAGWAPEVKNIVSELIAKRDQVAVACIASQHIAEILAKLMMFGFDDIIPVDLVYSCVDGRIDACVDDIMRRFNRDCMPVVVGSSREVSDAAQRRSMKYFRVMDFHDIKDLPRYVESLLNPPPPPQPQPAVLPPPAYPPHYPPGSYGGSYPSYPPPSHHGDSLLPPPLPPPPSYSQDPPRRDDDRGHAPLWPDAPPRDSQIQRSGGSDFDRPSPRENRSSAGPYRATMCKFFQIGRCNRGESCTFAHDESQLRKGGSGGVPDSVRMAEESRRFSYDQPPPPQRTASNTSNGTNGTSGGSYGDKLLALSGGAPTEPVVVEKPASRKRSRWGGIADEDGSTPVAVEPYNPLEPSADSMRAAQALLNGDPGALVMPTAVGYALPLPPSQLGFMVNPPSMSQMPPAAPSMPRPVMPTAAASAPKRSNAWGNLGI